MSIRVYIHGCVVLPDEARISVFDRGFLYGDSVYETVGTVGGQTFAMEEHLNRLERSAQTIGLRLPPREQILRAVAETIKAAGNPESRIRIMVTRGAGKLDLDPASVDDPQLIVIVQPLGGPTAQMYAEGVAAAIVPFTRSGDPTVKSGNYLNNVLALGEARRRFPGAHEAILISPDGAVAEGATSNIFAVVRGTLTTPPLEVGILAGVTRRKILDLARANQLTCEERRLSPKDLRTADEAFITSAARGVLPVTRVDGLPLGDGHPGPITLRIRALYLALQNPGGQA